MVLSQGILRQSQPSLCDMMTIPGKQSITGKYSVGCGQVGRWVYAALSLQCIYQIPKLWGSLIHTWLMDICSMHIVSSCGSAEVQRSADFVIG